MNGFVENIDKLTQSNEFFRQVIYTAKNMQLVLMNLKPNSEIGEEIHDLDQFIKIEDGQGVAILDGKRHEISNGYAVVIPAGCKHNILNTSSNSDMKLYTVYSPPEHRDRTVHKTKEEANASDEHFDGKTTED